MDTVSIDDIFHPLDPNNPGQFLTPVSSFGGPDDLADNPNPEFKFGHQGAGYNSSILPSGEINPIDYAALPPGMDKFITPGSEFDVVNPKNGKRVTVIYKEEGPGTKMRGLDVAPHTLRKLGANTDDKLIVDFTPAFMGRNTTAAPSPASDASNGLPTSSSPLIPRGITPPGTKLTPEGRFPQLSTDNEDEEPADEPEPEEGEGKIDPDLSWHNATDDFGPKDPRVNVLGGSYTKDDIQSYDPKTGITTFKNGLQVNPKLRQFSVPANGVRYTYSAAALNKNGQPGIVGTAPDESQLYQKADAEAMKKGADKGIFPQQFGIGTPDETPESKKLYHAALARALGANPQQYQEQKTSEALSFIEDFIDPRLNKYTTGALGKLGRAVPVLPNDAKYFNALLNSLKNRIGLNELQEMRNASKSGGALGQISDKENEILQNSLAALDPSLSADQLREQIDVVRRHLQAWQKAKQEHGAAAGVPPPTGDIPLITSQAEYDALPAGAWYRDSQGKKRKPQAQNPYDPAQQSLVNP